MSGLALFRFLLVGSLSLSTMVFSVPQQEVRPSQPQARAKTPPKEIPSMVLRVTTHLVIVDTIVTDRSGKAVRDLKAEDFKLYENGQPQEIRVFSFQQTLPETSAKTAKRILPENVYTNIPETNAHSGPPTILLIDALNTPTADRVYLHQQLVKYLQSNGPEQNFAIYLLGNRLQMLQDFTTDPELLKAAIKKFSLEPSAVKNEHPEDGIDDALERDLGDIMGGLPPSMIRALRQFEDQKIIAQTDMRVTITLDALRRIGRYLAGYPGRKNLIWVSAAFPTAVTSAIDGTLASNYSQAMRETANALTDAQVAIYPVDPRGLVNTSTTDITLSGRSPTGGARRGPDAADDVARRNATQENAHDSMKEMAAETGGRAFYNRNDIDNAIASSIEDGSAYYTLGYYPTNKNWDDKFHKIEVKLERKGLQVRSRKGYFATDPEKVARLDEKTARQEFVNFLTPGSPKATSLPFVVHVNPPNQATSEVIVDFSVEPHAIAFKRGDDNTEHAEMDFIVRAFDSKGKSAGNETQNLKADFKPETFAQIMTIGLRFRETIKLPPGKYLLEMGVRDARSNLMGTVSALVEVPQS